MSEFDRFFALYAERYMESDADAISDLCEAPFLAVREGRAIHLSDKDAVQQHFSEVMAAYARSGAARPDIHALAVEPLGKSSANATVHWHVRSADGELLKDFRTTYHVLPVESRWRLLAYTNHDWPTALAPTAGTRLGQRSETAFQSQANRICTRINTSVYLETEVRWDRDLRKTKAGLNELAGASDVPSPAHGDAADLHLRESARVG